MSQFILLKPEISIRVRAARAGGQRFRGRAHPPRSRSARSVAGRMYSVLSGKARSGQTEEQSLAKLNDQCDRLIRQIETSIERAESARADRTVPGEHDIVRGVPKPGEDIWVVSPPGPEVSARGRIRGSDASRQNAPRGIEASPATDADARGGPGAEPSARRAYPAGAFRDDFSEFSETNEDAISETSDTTGDDAARRLDGDRRKRSEAEADDAFRAGVSFADAGDLAAASRAFRRAKALCPASRANALLKIQKKLDETERIAWQNSQSEAGEAVLAADAAYRAAAACLEKSPADVDGAARHLRAAQRLCPPGRPAAMAKIERLMQSVEMKQTARHDT